MFQISELLEVFFQKKYKEIDEHFYSLKYSEKLENKYFLLENSP